MKHSVSSLLQEILVNDTFFKWAESNGDQVSEDFHDIQEKNKDEPADDEAEEDDVPHEDAFVVRGPHLFMKEVSERPYPIDKWPATVIQASEITH